MLKIRCSRISFFKDLQERIYRAKQKVELKKTKSIFYRILLKLESIPFNVKSIQFPANSRSRRKLANFIITKQKARIADN